MTFLEFLGHFRGRAECGKRNMLTTFSHNPFQPPHFSVSHGMCPNIWDFNEIKSKRTQNPLKNTRKTTNGCFPPLQPPCCTAGMGIQGGLVVMWGGCPGPCSRPHTRAALLALWCHVATLLGCSGGVWCEHLPLPPRPATRSHNKEYSYDCPLPTPRASWYPQSFYKVGNQ